MENVEKVKELEKSVNDLLAQVKILVNKVDFLEGVNSELSGVLKRDLLKKLDYVFAYGDLEDIVGVFNAIDGVYSEVI